MIKYSEGLGFLPVSSFIELNEFYNIEDLYDDSIKDNIKDIIFYNCKGHATNNLVWLLPRLITERYYITCITNIQEIIIGSFEPLIYSRLIVEISLEDFKKYNSNRVIEILSSLRDIDIILINDTTTNLLSIINKLNDLDINASLFYNSLKVNSDEILENKYYFLNKVEYKL